ATIWGDLRDYDDEKPIVEYFDRIVKGHMIRGAVFEVDIAFKYRRIYAVRDFNDPKFECVETILYD
ncbi:MAG: hypothetical protein SVK08_01505, partial [Halobacteriota archaeon]|nr:hypothetical protein [Halobacteriota archaeon]